MKKIRKSMIARAVVVSIALALVGSSTITAQAATKTITCYKGTQKKVVKGTNPKCPSGWSTKKPAVAPKPTTSASSTAKAGAQVLDFKGTYKGKMSLLWSESTVTARSVTATGTGDILGLVELDGTGSSSPSSQCDLFDGTGTISGGGNSLKLSFDTDAKACADDGQAPTDVKITGTATIKSGTGKYAGATGTLKVSGSFSIKSTAAGSSETTALTLTVSGQVKINS